MSNRRPATTLLCTLLLAASAGQAAAHDTWFQRLTSGNADGLQLALGTGNQFPVQESTVPRDHLDASGCRVNVERDKPLQPTAERPTALVLRGTWAAAPEATQGCWALLLPLLITIDDAVVPAYFKEIRASADLQARWAGMRARGLRWTEVYTKHARIEFDSTLADADGPRAAGATHTTAAIAGWGMDVRLTRPVGGLRAGDTLSAQVLRDGQPLAGQMIELRNNLSPLGLWRQTDAQGRLAITLPLAASWLLRGVDLRPSDTDPNRWDSRFITVAFEVQPRR